MIDFGGVTKIEDVSLVFGLASGTTITVDAEHIALSGIVFDSATSVDGQFSIGSAVTGKLSLVLMNDDDSLSSYDFRDATVTVFFTMEGATDPTQMGLYIVNEFRYDGSNISLTAYDYMSRFDYPCTYVGTKSEITFPATLLTIIQKAADVCDVSLLNRTTPFPNASYTVDQKPSGWNTMTWHDVIGFCAQIAGVYAKMDRYANLMFGWYEIPDAEDATQNTMDYHALEENYALSVDVSDVTITGLQVVLEPSNNIEADENTTTYTTPMYGSEGYTVTISDNPFIQTAAKARAVKDYLGARIVGMTFRPLNGTMVENPSIEAGDTALVSGVGDNVYQCFISHVTYTTHASTIIACDAEGVKSALSKRFTQSAKASNAVDQVRREVDSVATLAGNTTQHFWFAETGNDTGAHITRIPQEDFVDTPSMGNLLARDNGIAIRDGLTELATFSADGMDLYDSDGVVRTAHFGADAMVGKAADSHIEINDDGMSMYNNVPTECLKIGSSTSQMTTTVKRESLSDRVAKNGKLPLSGTVAWTLPADTETSVITQKRFFCSFVESGFGSIFNAEFKVGGTPTRRIQIATNPSEYLIFTLSSSWSNGTLSVGIAYSREVEYGSGSGYVPSGTMRFQGMNYTVATTSPGPSFVYGSLASGGSIGGFSAGLGDDVNPSGDYSAAIGQGVTAASDNQIAVGKYNANDSGNIFEIGNGTSGSPSNAFAVDSNGAAAFGDPGGTFAISSHVVSNGASIAAGGVNSGTTNITKSGYFPIGVVGYVSSSRYGVPTTFRISGAAVGSGTLNWAIYNPSNAARTPTCTMYVLWVKST